jgi:hypothetical protein
MSGCGIDLDPNTVAATMQRCLVVLEDPASPADFFRGVLVVALIALFALWCFARLVRA